MSVNKSSIWFSTDLVNQRKRSLISLTLCSTFLSSLIPQPLLATPPRTPDKTVECEILVVGGGLAGSAAAYEGLLAGRTVCLTEITDWVGGQISAQGTSALDERATQREQLFYPRGYLELRKQIEEYYDQLNPGACWVSESCFLPRDAHAILFEILQEAADEGEGTLKWYPSTVVKELELVGSNSGQKIESAIAIEHQPASGAPPLNTFPLSQTIEDWYRYEDSPRFEKTILRFVPKEEIRLTGYVVDATETGELIALGDVPYRLGVDPISYLNPSASSTTPDPYCTQGFTYTFAMKATEEPQNHEMPSFYPQYEPYYSYELERLADFGLVFTYRRIWSPEPGEPTKFGGIGYTTPTPGDISMQNWTWGNDFRPGTAQR